MVKTCGDNLVWNGVQCLVPNAKRRNHPVLITFFLFFFTVADRFLAQKSISMMGKSYEIGASTKEAPKSILHKDVETFKDIETEERSQTVEVHKRKEGRSLTLYIGLRLKISVTLL